MSRNKHAKSRKNCSFMAASVIVKPHMSHEFIHTHKLTDNGHTEPLGWSEGK